MTDHPVVVSYSQNAEDIVLNRLFRDQPSGSYIDVGASHPELDSVTKLFYDRGWHGINIDATPGVVQAFNKCRPRDLNVEAAVANERSELTFFMFKEPGLNTLSREVVKMHSRQPTHRSSWI